MLGEFERELVRRSHLARSHGANLSDEDLSGMSLMTPDGKPVDEFGNPAEVEESDLLEEATEM